MKFIFAGFVILFSHTLIAQNSNGGGRVYGEITLPNIDKFIKRGKGYNQDGSPMMHSDDPMAKPENNVIISFHPLSFKPELTLTPNAYVTQKEQTFLPAVLPIVVGSSIYLLNEDEFFHNIYSLSPGSRFNIGRRPPGSPYQIKISRKGAIKLSCEIHPHMSGTILSLDTPYFTRIKPDRTYSMQDLPNGRYRVSVFGPGKLNFEKEIDLSSNNALQLNIDLKQ